MVCTEEILGGQDWKQGNVIRELLIGKARKQLEPGGGSGVGEKALDLKHIWEVELSSRADGLSLIGE